MAFANPLTWGSILLVWSYDKQNQLLLILMDFIPEFHTTSIWKKFLKICEISQISEHLYAHMFQTIYFIAWW
jgi:hydrogenase maturation factor HypF (carbamoyltransferase family)